MKSRAFLFGAGWGGVRAYRFFKKRFHIIGILDNDPLKNGIHLSGLLVSNPSLEMFERDILVIISSQYHEQISKQLLELGVAPENIVVANREVLQGVYETPRSFVWIATLCFITFILAILGMIRLVLDLTSSIQ